MPIPTNYIKRLQAENAALQARIEAMQHEIMHFRLHLGSTKFANVEGKERRDWIATGDVTSWLDRIRDAEPEQPEETN